MRKAALILICACALPARAEPAPDSEEQFLIDVKNVLNEPGGPPLSPVIPGKSFSDLAGPHLAALEASWERLRGPEQEASVVEEISEGRRPLADLPDAWQQELAHEREHVTAVLAATHAEHGTLPFPLTVFGVFAEPEPSYGAPALLQGSKLGNLLELEALAAGDSHGAADLCAEQLSLAAHESHGCLINQMTAFALAHIAMRTCHFVAARGTPDDRKTLADAAAAARSSWFPFARTLRQESVLAQLTAFRTTLTPAIRAQIPAAALIQLRVGTDSNGHGVRAALFGGWARRTHVRNMREAEAASELSPRDGDAVFTQMGQTWSLASVLAGSGIDSSPSWLEFMRRWRAGQARLALFQAELAVRLAHDRLSHWPRDWAEVGEPAPADPRSGKPIALVPESEGVRLVPAADGPRTEDDLSVEVR